jgi:hypothetical protein
MTLFTLVLDIRTAEVEFRKTVVKILALFFDANDRMNKDRIDGSLRIKSAFGSLVDKLLAVFTRKEAIRQHAPGKDTAGNPLGNDVVPLGAVRLSRWFKSGLKLRKHINQDLGRVLL